MKKHFGATHSVLDDQANASTSTQSTASGNRETNERNKILEKENNELREILNIQRQQMTKDEEEKQNLRKRIKELEV